MNEITKSGGPEIKNLIYEIRGKQVMLDSDLAKLYGVETKRINEAVKNNTQKFPERFSWKLSDEECKSFLVENFDQKVETRGGKYKNPRVFTEQGVMMLATILKSSIATEVTIRIMDAFVAMKRYISGSLIEQKYVNEIVLENRDRIKLLEQSFEKFSEKKDLTGIYFNGHIYDAYSAVFDAFKEAKESLIIIDAYADKTLLDITRRLKSKIVLITTDTHLSAQDIEKYNEQYDNLAVFYDNTFHDRYFILDNKTVYHCGTSINRIGHKTFSITKINDRGIIELLLDRIRPYRPQN
ncbi:ORF6N domain-containing protein [Candidatus Saccharibacteria bacterium]|nr:ORF6N domain-containing protein [Candidatus Saccharibacteria bacterium]